MARPRLTGACEEPCKGTADGRRFYLVPVQGDGRQGQRGDMEGAVLHEAADVAHGLSKDPRAVHEPNLRGKQQVISQQTYGKQIHEETLWIAPELAHAFWLAGWAAPPETQRKTSYTGFSNTFT